LNSRFDTNAAGEAAGAMFAGNNSVCNITDTVCINNTAPFGAAIYTSVNSTLTITDTQLVANSANASGGAVYVSNGADLTMTDTVCDSNNAASAGGCVYIESVVNVSISRSRFTSNNANFGAALFSSTSSTPIISDSQFVANAASSGGAVFADSDSDLIVKNSSFVGNSANKSYDDDTRPGLGGASSTYGGASIAGCQFSDYTAYAGGAVAIGVNQTASISGCSFVNNSANLVAGAVSIAASCHVAITDCEFSLNSAYFGGSIQTDALPTNDLGALLLTNSTFNGNSADDSGGALRLLGSSTVLHISNCTFINHTAGSGGAIAVYLHTANITGSSFINNTAFSNAGSILASTPTVVEISNSNFTGGQATVGGALATYADSEVT
jgi:hypothetical protein